MKLSFEIYKGVEKESIDRVEGPGEILLNRAENMFRTNLLDQAVEGILRGKSYSVDKYVVTKPLATGEGTIIGVALCITQVHPDDKNSSAVIVLADPYNRTINVLSSRKTQDSIDAYDSGSSQQLRQYLIAAFEHPGELRRNLNNENLAPTIRCHKFSLIVDSYKILDSSQAKS